MSLAVAESQYVQDSMYVLDGFVKPIEVPEVITIDPGWYSLGKITNKSTGEDVPVGLKVRGGKQTVAFERTNPFSARLAEELMVIAALERSSKFDTSLLPLFMGLAVDQKNYEVGLLMEDLAVDGEEGWQVTQRREKPVGIRSVKNVLEGMKIIFREAGFKVDDYTLDNNVLFEFGGRLAACDLEQILLINDEPAESEYEKTLKWVREGHLNVPIMVKGRLDEAG